jgi:hypothetical protein
MVKHSFNRFTLFKLFRIQSVTANRAPLGQQTEESVVRPNAVPTQEPLGRSGKTVVTQPVSLRRSAGFV